MTFRTTERDLWIAVDRLAGGIGVYVWVSRRDAVRWGLRNAVEWRNAGPPGFWFQGGRIARGTPVLSLNAHGGGYYNLHVHEADDGKTGETGVSHSLALGKGKRAAYDSLHAMLAALDLRDRYRE